MQTQPIIKFRILLLELAGQLQDSCDFRIVVGENAATKIDVDPSQSLKSLRGKLANRHQGLTKGFVNRLSMEGDAFLFEILHLVILFGIEQTSVLESKQDLSSPQDKCILQNVGRGKLF